MTVTGRVTRFAVAASASAGVGLGVTAPFLRAIAADGLFWGGVGWAAAAATGVAAGAWLAGIHGKPGTGFLVAFGAGMLARLSAAGAAVAAAATAGTTGGTWACLAGFAGGYVPVQAFEVVWFYRASRGPLRGAAMGDGRS